MQRRLSCSPRVWRILGPLLAAGVVLAPARAQAQDDVIACTDVPTYFPRRDHWALEPGGMVTFSQQKDGSPDIGTGAEMRAVHRAFGTWMLHECSPGIYPNVLVRDDFDFSGEDHPTRDRGDTYENGNLVAVKSVIYWVESGWSAGSQTVALTTNLFFDDTGRLVDSDMEFNGINFTWRARADVGGPSTGCAAGTSGCFDVETVALHEAGHYLGLNHVDCSDAVMFPHGAGNSEIVDLSIHEKTGLCKLYPPRPASVATERYFGEECISNSQCSTGLCIHPGTLGDGEAWGWCARRCDCTDGCANNCPQAFECVQHAGTGVNFCRPGIHLTGGSTTGGCSCDVGSGCSTDCDCDEDCVPCGGRGDCAVDQICDGGTCGPCSADAQCDGQICSGGRCVPCAADTDCGTGQVCKSGRCGACTGDPDCDGGKVCVAGACSACTSSCPGGQICSGGACVPCASDTQCDGQVCVSGSCVNCSTTNACSVELVCSGGRCGPCDDNTDCSGGRYCASGLCKPCTESGHCDVGLVCSAGSCRGCLSTGECTAGRVCVSGGCDDCSSDQQCATGDVCSATTKRCGAPPDDGGDDPGDGGVTDPGTGLSLDFCQPCVSGSDCASGVCLSDGEGQAICTHACYGTSVPGAEIPSAACPPSFDCVSTDLGYYACWPQDATACGGDTIRPELNSLCYDERGGGDGDDWYSPCGAGLVCFAFKPRCAGKQGACVIYCNESEPCPDANMQCCYGVDAGGACLGADSDSGRVHGGCFEIREEGESCVSAEQSICAAGHGCYSFGDAGQAKCYEHCASGCDPGSSCAQSSDACSNDFDLCCDNAALPATCKPGETISTKLDFGFSCTTDTDCDSQFCVANGGSKVCSRHCSAVTGIGCPGDSYDADGDGLADGGFDCLSLGGPDPAAGFCWPAHGPVDNPDPPYNGGTRPGKAPPPPEGLCSATGATGLFVWLPLLIFTRRRGRRRASSSVR